MKRVRNEQLDQERIHFSQKKLLRQVSHTKQEHFSPKQAPAASLTRKTVHFSQKAPAAMLTRKEIHFPQKNACGKPHAQKSTFVTKTTPAQASHTQKKMCSYKKRKTT